MRPAHVVVLLAIATVIIILIAASSRSPEPDPPSNETTVSFHLDDGSTLDFTCEIADTSYERADGLQHRENLPRKRGMLFVYDEPRLVSYLMHNMNFPLDIIFIAENGTVLNVEEAEPEAPGTPDEDLVRYRSDGEVLWVVEINQGLSREHGIGPGTQVDIGPID